MNSRALKIFKVVYEKLNMTAAAESLYISQPSVSQVIKELEEYYEVQLFERISRKLLPTAEGVLLYKYASQILGLYDETYREIRQLSGQGEIRIGANISVGTELLLDYIKVFKSRYPDIGIKVKVSGSAKLTQMLMDHSIDFALMEDLIHDKALIQEPFYNDRVVVVCRPDDPILERKGLKYADIKDEVFLLREKGVGVRDNFDYLMKMSNIDIEPAWEAVNTKALVNAVKAGYGISILPYLLVKKYIDAGDICIVDMDEDSLSRKLNITYQKEKIFNKWCRLFMEILRAERDYVKVNP